MSPHLGARVTPLVDGRLGACSAERAVLHAAACPGCAQELRAERGVRRALGDAPDPLPSAELTARLLALGGPQGPLGPRPGHVPGTPRPALLPPPGRLPASSAPWRGSSRRPGGRRDAVRPGLRSRLGRRGSQVAVAVGVLSLASVGLLGVAALDGPGGVQGPGPMIDRFVVEPVRSAGR